MSLFSELKRRHVLRTAGVYILAAWALIQVADIVGEAFGLTDAGMRLLIIALIAAFFPAVTVSWFYEFTPSGIQIDADAPGDATQVVAKRSKIDSLILVGLVVALSYIIVDAVLNANSPRYELSMPRPLVSTESSEYGPALSPDGKYVAYVWLRTGLPPNIFVRAIDGVDPVQLTDTQYDERSAAWSPDGTEIAFVRGREEGGWDIVISSFPAATERTVHRTGPDVHSYELDWSPDGEYLVISDQDHDSPPGIEALYLLALENGQVSQLTYPASDPDAADPDNEVEDGWPRISPDGERVAFVRTRGINELICVSKIAGGPARCFNHDGLNVVWDHDWLPDSRSLAVITGGPMGGKRSLVSYSVETGEQYELLQTPGISGVSTARNTGLVVLAMQDFNRNLMRLRGPAASNSGKPVRIAASTLDERWPDISPDGTQLVFFSNRRGKPELWLSRVDDTVNARPIVSLELDGNYPKWSPNGQSIAFTSDPYKSDVTGHWTVPIAVVEINSAYPQRLIDIGFAPSWSADGLWIYYNSPESLGEKPCDNGYRILRRRVSGGESELLVDCGVRPIEGPDGRLYYVDRSDGDKLMSVEIGGDDFRTEVESVNFMYWGFSLKHLVYVDGEDKILRIRNLDTGEISHWATPFANGGVPRNRSVRSLSVSLDDEWIVYTREDEGEVDLMISELTLRDE